VYSTAQFLGTDAKLDAIDKEVDDVKQMLEAKIPFSLKVSRSVDPIATGISQKM
jgi:hypothetical protein